MDRGTPISSHRRHPDPPPPSLVRSGKGLSSLPAPILAGNLSSFLARAARGGAATPAGALGTAPDVRPSLRALILDGHALAPGPETLPDAALTRLEALSCARCALRAPPHALRTPNLARLRSLNLRGNPLGFAFDAFATLPRGLEVLDVSDCALTAYPDFRRATPRLTSLLLAGNVGLGGGGEPTATATALILLRLARLDLSRCGLTRLPAAVLALPALCELNIEDNELTDLPPALGALPSLGALASRGNALRGLRHELISAGGRQLLDFLRARIPRGAENDAFDTFAAALSEAAAALAVGEMTKDVENGAAFPGPGARSHSAAPDARAMLSGVVSTRSGWPGASGGVGDFGLAIDPVSQLDANEINRRIDAVEARLEAVSGLSAQRAALARRDLAALRAAAVRANAVANS